VTATTGGSSSRWAILAALSLTRFSFGYQFQSMASVAPMVSRELGLDQAAVGTLIGLFWASGVLVSLPGGWLGQRFGDKRAALAGGALVVAGGLLCAFGGSYAALAAGRFIAGLGGIVMNIMAVKMVADWFAGREIGFAFGALFGSFPLGIALALAAQAPLAEAAGWPAVMLSTAVVGAAVLAAIALVYRAPAAAAAAPASPRPAPRGFLPRRELALLTVSGIALALYNGAFLVYVSYAPTLLAASGFGVVESGVVLAAASAVATFSLPAGGHLADRSGRPRAVLFGGAAAFCICVALLPAAAATHSLLAVAVVAVLVSVLGSIPVSPMMALPAAAVPPERRALGLGLFYTWFYVGAALSPPLGGWVYDLAGTPAAPIYLNAVLGVGTIAFFILFGVLAQQKRRPQAPFA
jgi:predicted MFS family arabinose efflux permease